MSLSNKKHELSKCKTTIENFPIYMECDIQDAITEFLKDEYNSRVIEKINEVFGERLSSNRNNTHTEDKDE